MLFIFWLLINETDLLLVTQWLLARAPATHVQLAALSRLGFIGWGICLTKIKIDSPSSVICSRQGSSAYPDLRIAAPKDDSHENKQSVAKQIFQVLVLQEIIELPN